MQKKRHRKSHAWAPLSWFPSPPSIVRGGARSSDWLGPLLSSVLANVLGTGGCLSGDWNGGAHDSTFLSLQPRRPNKSPQGGEKSQTERKSIVVTSPLLSNHSNSIPMLSQIRSFINNYNVILTHFSLRLK
jgi:hypothetical protein